MCLVVKLGGLLKILNGASEPGCVMGSGSGGGGGGGGGGGFALASAWCWRWPWRPAALVLAARLRAPDLLSSCKE